MWYMTSIEYVNLITQSKRKFLTTKDLDALISTESKRTLEDIVKRLVSGKVLTQLERGKYYVTNMQVSDFEVAQFLYAPSYISFETALNYHGILSQFPLEITSATTKRRTTKLINDKAFSYAKINSKIFTGYYKEDDYLMAYPEKALFDQLYMISKSIKTEEYLDEMDYSQIDVKEVGKYLELVSDSTKSTVSNLLKKYL